MSREEDEAAQHEAERKAAALHNLGWEVGTGATIWARAVQDVLCMSPRASGSEPEPPIVRRGSGSTPPRSWSSSPSTRCRASNDACAA